MQNTSTLNYILLIALAFGCSSDKQTKDGLAFVDVRKNYPGKEIILTDIADVTYLCLNSDDDDYLYKGRIHCITENTIVIGDDVSGSVLFFSKDGMPKSRFNRKGQGPGEYIDARQVIYDEKADDVFVLSSGLANYFLVYSTTGEYKRKIMLSEGTYVQSFHSFDDVSLFVYDGSVERRNFIPLENDSQTEFYDSHFIRISKTDGKVLDYVELPSNNIVLKDEVTRTPFAARRLIKCKDGVLLCNPETDTVFHYTKDRSLIPVIHKTPSINTLDPVVILNNCADVGSYQFMEVVTVHLEREGFLTKYMMRDKKTGEIFHQNIRLPDYTGKEFFFRTRIHGDFEDGPYFDLDLIELKQAERENKLNGKLKELVATLNEDEDNNVFMLVNFK